MIKKSRFLNSIRHILEVLLSFYLGSIASVQLEVLLLDCGMCQFPRLLVHAAHHEVRKVLGATSWVGKKPSTREDLLDIALVREVARSPTKDGVVQRKPLPHVPHEHRAVPAGAHSFASTLPTAQAAWALESHRPAPEQGAALKLAQLRS